MSNLVCIKRTVFKNYSDGNETYGYRMYDEYNKEYSNTMERVDMDLPPEEFLRKMQVWFNETEGEMFDDALEKGWIEIDGEDYRLELDENGWSLKKED